MIEMVYVSEEDMRYKIRICILLEAEDIILIFAIIYVSETLPPLDVGVHDANALAFRKPTLGHELCRDVHKDSLCERLYAEVNRVAQ